MRRSDEQLPHEASGTEAYRCPLCGGLRHSTLEQFAYDEIWKGFRERGICLEPEVERANTPAPYTTLARCESCGLDVFYPLASGNLDFYERLMSREPYVPYRWDFVVAASVVTAGDDVVDLGCGEGVFLDWIASKAARRVGIDFNRQAIRRLKARGIEAEVADVQDYARVHEGQFDVVTALQTLEHLETLVDFGRAALRLLRKGGSLIISVPNRQRLNRARLEVFDVPPHHVSRWSPQQLRKFARRIGMETGWVRIEPGANLTLGALYFPVVEHYLVARMGAQSLDRLRARAFRVSTALQRYVPIPSRLRSPHRGGHSLVARFRA